MTFSAVFSRKYGVLKVHNKKWWYHFGAHLVCVTLSNSSHIDSYSFIKASPSFLFKHLFLFHTQISTTEKTLITSLNFSYVKPCLLQLISLCQWILMIQLCLSEARDQKQLNCLNETKSCLGGGWNMSGCLIRPFLGLFGPIIDPIR